MDRSVGLRRVGSKSLKTSTGHSNSPAKTSSQSGYKGHNAVCQRETPTWQKPITNFFNKADTGNIESKNDDGNEEEKRIVNN